MMNEAVNPLGYRFDIRDERGWTYGTYLPMSEALANQVFGYLKQSWLLEGIMYQNGVPIKRFEKDTTTFPDQGIPDQELWDGINTSYQVYLSFLDKWVDVLLTGVDFSHPTHECIEVTPEFFDTDKQEWARSYSAHAFQASGYKVYDPPNSFLRAKLTRAQWRRYLRRVSQQNLQLPPETV